MKSHRGFTLIELMIVVFIVALLTLTIFAVSLSRKPGEISAARSLLNSQFTYANSLARLTGNGSTIYIHPDTNSAGRPETIVTVYPGRPNTNPIIDSGTTGKNWTNDFGSETVWNNSQTVQPRRVIIPISITGSNVSNTSTLSSIAGHQLAIFIDTSNTATYQNLVLTSSALANQPSCIDTFTFVLHPTAGATQTATMPCGSAILDFGAAS